METVDLFRNQEGKWLTNKDLLEALKSLHSDEADILYIHSSLSFGIPNPELKRKELLSIMLETIKALDVPTIYMPTFTFSYCNGKSYDPDTSKSRMGALNEFFRKQEDVVRSCDPLMSVAVWGKDKDAALRISNQSISDNSTFDILRHKDGVKFLFLGTRIGDCFTYMHYLEWLYDVPYRYNRWFLGESVIDGKPVTNEYSLFVRHNGVLPNTNSYIYENKMYENGKAAKCAFGDSSISFVGLPEGTEEYHKCLLEDPFFFVNVDKGSFTPDKTFRVNGEMVAL